MGTWGQTQQYFVLTSHFALRDHTWQAWETLWDGLFQPGLLICKSDALAAVISLELPNMLNI